MKTNAKEKYILLGPAYGIGGWQLYIDYRCKYLMEKGTELYLIHDPSVGGKEIKLLNTKKAKKLSVEMDEPYWYSKKHIEREMEKILAFIEYSKGDNVFIESTSMIYSMWGELIAKSTCGQNYCYLMHSHTSGMPLAWRKFFSFKYDQDLIAGQSGKTLPELFEGFREIEDTKCIEVCWDSPICEEREDCLEYIEYLRKKKEEGNILIGYFGVLRKPHFELLCDWIENYAKTKEKSKFCLVAIGSSGTGKPEEKLNHIGSLSENCSSYNIPELYPTPREIFMLLDLCVASFGSANSAALACKRTVRLQNDLDLCPQGVIGIHLTKQPYWNEPSCGLDLRNIFDEILFGNNYKDHTYVAPALPREGREGHIEEDKHMRPFQDHRNGYKYYPVMDMYKQGDISQIKYILFHMFGIEFTRKVARILRGNR